MTVFLGRVSFSVYSHIDLRHLIASASDMEKETGGGRHPNHIFQRVILHHFLEKKGLIHSDVQCYISSDEAARATG